MMYDPMDQRAGQPLSTNHILEATKADLDRTIGAVRNGAQAFCTDGRKTGESAGNGTGVLVYYDVSSESFLRLSDDSALAV